MVMRTSEHGIAVMHYFEDCKLAAYPDPGSHDGTPWTIGRGHTGPEVCQGLCWSQQQADSAFVDDLRRFEDGVKGMVLVAIKQGQFDALVCLAYNIGLKSLARSTLMKLLNAGNYEGAAMQFCRWCKNDGKVMKGLIRRRRAEECLFRGMPGADAIKQGVAAA